MKSPESDYNSQTFSADFYSTSNPSLLDEPISSYMSSTVSKDSGEPLFISTSIFSSFASDELAPGPLNILSNEKLHVYSIFCILLILIFIFFIILFLIIFRCKSSFQKRSKGKNGITKKITNSKISDHNLPLEPSYFKARYTKQNYTCSVSP